MIKEKPLSEKKAVKILVNNYTELKREYDKLRKDVAEHVEGLRKYLEKEGVEVDKDNYPNIKLIDPLKLYAEIDKIFGEFHNNTKLADTAKDNYSPQGMSSKKTHLFEMLPEDTQIRAVSREEYLKACKKFKPKMIGILELAKRIKDEDREKARKGCGKVWFEGRFHYLCTPQDLCPKCEDVEKALDGAFNQLKAEEKEDAS